VRVIEQLSTMMSSSAALEAAKSRLKKTDVTTVVESNSSSSNNNSVLPTLCETSEDYTKLMKETFLEQYFDAIRSHTFASAFVPLTRDAARLMLAKDRAALLAELAPQIDAARRDLGVDKVFVRLSSRSPKDAPLSLAAFPALLERTRARMREPLSANARAFALQIAATLAMGASSGAEAVDLLVASARIRDDLQQFVDGNLGDDFRVCVREFRHFPLEFELRAFVFNRRVTAITQYNPYLFFPLLVKHKASLVARVVEFVRQTLPQLTLDHCVLDLMLVRAQNDDVDDFFLGQDDAELDVGAFRVMIVELNPFAEFAGEGLFSWVSDKALLMGRRDAANNVTVRIVETPEAVLSSHEISSEWQQFL
jgi:hypothetical protein